MSDNSTSNRTDTVCNVGGKLYYYDACGDKSDEIKNGFVYMGSGNIHSIKGAPYRSERVFHFWRYNDRTLLDARVTE